MNTKYKDKRKQILILCLLVFTVMCGQLYSQGTYKLIFVNNSSDTGSACVYQVYPYEGNSMLWSLAWFAKRAAPTTEVVFQWEIDYSFVCGETGKLAPGVIFHASQTLPANQNELIVDERGCRVQQDPACGFLCIVVDKIEQRDTFAAGIGMSGAATNITQANTGVRVKIIGQSTYWIAFGNYTQGEVLDLTELINHAQVKFPPGVYSMTAILNADHTWTIKPTAEVNADFVKAKKKNKKARWGKY